MELSESIKREQLLHNHILVLHKLSEKKSTIKYGCNMLDKRIVHSTV